MSGLIGLLVLALLAVPVLLVIALVMVAGLRRRVAALEAQVAGLASRASPAAAAEPAPLADSEPTLQDWMRARAAAPTVAAPPPAAGNPPASPRAATDPARAVFDGASAGAPPAATDAALDAAAPPVPPPLPLPPRAAPAYARRPPPPNPFDLAFRAARRWFTEGNLPVKVGVLVLLAGVAALLKFATDAGLLSLPIELRLGAVALAAIGGLVFGWRQREARRPFGLALQGGAIGVLLLVVFAAFRLYGLLPAGAAFALSVALVAGMGVLAVLQNALALAVFAVLAGFLAPIWLSTGQGNHVALFGYYAVLNVAIAAIAWWRPWRLLNVLGFVFTFAIGTAWGVLRYRPDDYATTQPFLLLFFALYLAIPILFARRRGAARRDAIDGCLLFGTPLVAFALQAALLDGERLPLAYCALALGAIYALLAAALRRYEHLAALVAPYAVLAVGFATLAVPLALSASATACVFALEGAGLVWLGLRQQRALQVFAGVVLQLAAALAFVFGSGDAGSAPIANGAFMGALLIAVAALASAWSFHRAGSTAAAALFYAWGLAWWARGGLGEIERFVAIDARADAVLAWSAATGWLAAEALRRVEARALAWTVAAALWAAVPLAWWQDAAHAQPFAGLGWAAWAAYALFGVLALRRLAARDDEASGAAHVGWLASWTMALSLAAYETARVAGLGDGWRFAAAALPTLAVAALLHRRPGTLAMPFGARFDAWRDSAQGATAAVLVALGAVSLAALGGSAPLPWVSVLNPLELWQLAALGVLEAWLASDRAPDGLRARRVPLLAFAGFASITAATLRACHHWGDVPWGAGMLGSNLVQTSLTVVWSVLGVVGWIVGSRRGQRGLWLAGAVLMGVVLVKLVLVDRQHLGNLTGIVSFLAYGALCAVVGYFAPQPPRDPDLGPLEPEQAR
ncbi:DUF2339 domain-containing protein [Cognatilysobacter tabacisoli]|uniref:DUF2339 domain-containing protein n=1 Tax=Cognatilysobacter tabacisoli TaxID=2315424 RepID=UPI000E6B0286|nr:DUF2339 domain-containing protein [Lysobacter tabacisoli]